ncbi:hypothetical protein Trydic_g9284 [Trypoxylus dichotomus]
MHARQFQYQIRLTASDPMQEYLSYPLVQPIFHPKAARSYLFRETPVVSPANIRYRIPLSAHPLPAALAVPYGEPRSQIKEL